MERPELLNTVTVKETMAQYRKNQRVFDRAVLLIVTGSFTELSTPPFESVLNQMYTELITQQEYTYQSWIPETEVTEWDGKRQAIYANGVVLGKFREKDASTLQVLKEGVSNQGLYNEIRINLFSTCR